MLKHLIQILSVMKINPKDSLDALVNAINHKYSELHNISNDDIRTRVKEIELQINDSKDPKGEFALHLPEVYAIVKEVSRRFTEGDIIVSATLLDHILAKETDYIIIEGDNARYKNNWHVEGQDFHWNMIHYDEQLLGGIYLHYGYATEMATGEGKTLVATLPCVLNGITHKGVYVMTVNNYLSKRDYQITRPLYSFFGLTTACIELNKDNRDFIREAYKADIVFGTYSSFTFDYLYDHLTLSVDRCVNQRHNYAIIDEIDSILIDESVTPHIVGGGSIHDVGELYKQYLPVVRELIDNHVRYESNIHTKAVSYTRDGIEWLKDKTGISTLYDVVRTYEVDGFDLLSTEEKDKIKNNIELQNALNQILAALTVYQKDVDYLVDNDTIKIIDPNTGRVKDNNRWQHGLHTAIEVKEDVKIKCDSDSIAVISLKSYFKLYTRICGMSGTIMSIQDELHEIYGLKCKSIPTHKPCIRKDLPLRVYKTEKEKDEALIKYILQNKSEGRPSLVCSSSVRKSEELGDKLSEKGLVHNTLNAKTIKGEANIISKAGEGNTITIATCVAGRGTDIKPSKDALKCGGLVVIGSDYFESIRVEKQLRGRTSRQGNPGTSVFFTSLEDPILNYLSEDDKMELQDIVDNISNNNYSTEDITAFFVRAQQSREKFLKEKRKTCAQKDDIIAPHRKKYYDERNVILFSNTELERGFERIIDNSDIESNITRHIEELHTKARKLTSRSRRNNLNQRSVDVPFSYNQYLFTLNLSVNKVDDFNYFYTEFRKAIFLQTYDLVWKEFVTYIMSDLDTKEIGELDNKFTSMRHSINTELVNRMLNSIIPYNQTDSKPDVVQGEKRCTIYRTEKYILKNDQVCPCGSGKKYCECHGSNIRNNIRRR